MSTLAIASSQAWRFRLVPLGALLLSLLICLGMALTGSSASDTFAAATLSTIMWTLVAGFIMGLRSLSPNSRSGHHGFEHAMPVSLPTIWAARALGVGLVCLLSVLVAAMFMALSAGVSTSVFLPEQIFSSFWLSVGIILVPFVAAGLYYSVIARRISAFVLIDLASWTILLAALVPLGRKLRWVQWYQDAEWFAALLLIVLSAAWLLASLAGFIRGRDDAREGSRTGALSFLAGAIMIALAFVLGSIWLTPRLEHLPTTQIGDWIVADGFDSGRSVEGAYLARTDGTRIAVMPNRTVISGNGAVAFFAPLTPDSRPGRFPELYRTTPEIFPEAEPSGVPSAWTMAINHDGSLIATRVDERTTAIWNPLEKQLIASVRLHEGFISDLEFIGDDLMVISRFDSALGESQRAISTMNAPDLLRVSKLDVDSGELRNVAETPANHLRFLARDHAVVSVTRGRDGQEQFFVPFSEGSDPVSLGIGTLTVSKNYLLLTRARTITIFDHSGVKVHTIDLDEPARVAAATTGSDWAAILQPRDRGGQTNYPVTYLLDASTGALRKVDVQAVSSGWWFRNQRGPLLLTEFSEDGEKARLLRVDSETGALEPVFE